MLSRDQAESERCLNTPTICKLGTIKSALLYPAVNLAYLKRLSLRAFASWLLTSMWERLRNVIRKDYARPFVTRASLIRLPVIHPRFTKLIEQSIPDADVVIATAWQTAYTVDRLSDNKGDKFYFVQNYEIWDVWNEIKCWNEIRKHKRSNETCAVSMARVIPKKKNLRDAKGSSRWLIQTPIKEDNDR